MGEGLAASMEERRSAWLEEARRGLFSAFLDRSWLEVGDADPGAADASQDCVLALLRLTAQDPYDRHLELPILTQLAGHAQAPADLWTRLIELIDTPGYASGGEQTAAWSQIAASPRLGERPEWQRRVRAGLSPAPPAWASFP